MPALLCVLAALVSPALGAEDSLPAGSQDFWMFLIASIVLIVISGLMSGLTVGTLLPNHSYAVGACGAPSGLVSPVCAAARVRVTPGYMSLDTLTMEVLASQEIPEDPK